MRTFVPVIPTSLDDAFVIDPDDTWCSVGSHEGLLAIRGVLSGDFATLIKHRKTMVRPRVNIVRLYRVKDGDYDSAPAAMTVRGLSLLTYLTLRAIQGTNDIEIMGIVGQSAEAKEHMGTLNYSSKFAAHLTFVSRLNDAAFVAPQLGVTRLESFRPSRKP